MEFRRVVALAALSIAFTPAARAAQPFSEAMVSITFDDGESSQYLSRAVFAQYGYHATYFPVSDAISSWGAFFVANQLKDLAADGHEIGSHTLDHADLTLLNDADLDRQLRVSRLDLMAKLGLPDVKGFCYPYGNFNARVEQAVAQYYRYARTTEPYYNFRDTDPYLLGSFDCNNSTTLAQLTSKVDVALANKSWVVFHFHALTTAPSTERYSCMVSTLASLVDYVAQKNLKVVTIGEGVALMTEAPAAPPQLTLVSPTSGPPAGGTTVTLTGTGFQSGATVVMGGVAASVTSVTSTRIVAVTPAHAAGPVAVTVTNPDATSATAANAFTYVALVPSSEPFAEGMVSITFDDGDKTQYLSRAVLAQYGYHATYFLISDSLSSWSDFFTISQVLDLAADRHEIGSHTLDHVDLTQLSDADLDRELSGSRSALMAKLGLPDVQSFSYPYGNFDSRVEQAVARYYRVARTNEPW